MDAKTKPESPEAFLEHYGVLGMKWGNRMQAKGKDIKAARKRVTAQRQAVDKQERHANQTTGAKGKAEQQKLSKMKMDYLNNPDRVVAARMTRGEKAAVLILSVPAFFPTAGNSVPLAVGAIAGTSARSRRIEQKQQTGAYKKNPNLKA